MHRTEAASGSSPDQGAYEIRIQGRLDSRWASWFDGLTLTTAADGTTVLHGPIVDQAALHGVLQKLRDLGLPLISVGQPRVDTPQPVVPIPENPSTEEGS